MKSITAERIFLFFFLRSVITNFYSSARFYRISRARIARRSETREKRRLHFIHAQCVSEIAHFLSTNYVTRLLIYFEVISRALGLSRWPYYLSHRKEFPIYRRSLELFRYIPNAAKNVRLFTTHPSPYIYAYV